MQTEDTQTALAKEAVLLRRWRQGDEDAFNQLIKNVMPAMERLSLQMTGDPSLADDVIANALLRAYRSGKHFNGESQFKTWMHRIVVNCVLDERRKARVSNVSLNDLHDEDDGSHVQMQLADSQPSALDLILNDERVRQVRATIDRLSLGQRKLIHLFHGQGLGYAAIAQASHDPVGTVKSRLHRARQVLAQRIAFENLRQESTQVL